MRLSRRECPACDARALFCNFVGLELSLWILESIGFDEAGHSRRDGIGAAGIPFQRPHGEMALLAREERAEID